MAECSGQLSAGAGEVDITPPEGTNLAGMIGLYRPAEVTLDPLHARALVVENGGTRVCFLSLELLAVANDWVAKIRAEAQKRFGLEPQALMIHTVQNHAAPMIGARMPRELVDWLPENGEWLLNDAGDFNPYAVERIMEAIGQAIDRLEPVSVTVGRGFNDRVAFCRRYVMRDGTTVTQPKPSDLPNILHRETSADPEVGVACLTGKALNPVAVLLHYTCHPVHGVGGRAITAGWPGEWARQVREGMGGAGVPMVVNGCCGNIIHRNWLDPTYDDAPEVLGASLAATTRAVMRSMGGMADATVRHITKYVTVPYRQVDPEELENSRRLLAEHPEPMWLNEEKTRVDWAWCYATSVLDVHALAQREATYEYEVQAFRIGKIALVALTGEPFVQGQFKIKAGSPGAYTWPAHMANGYVGYLPTREAFKGGGYETKTAIWSRFDPAALDLVTDCALEVLEGLYK